MYANSNDDTNNSLVKHINWLYIYIYIYIPLYHCVLCTMRHPVMRQVVHMFPVTCTRGDGVGPRSDVHIIHSPVTDSHQTLGYHKCTITARTGGPAPEDGYHKCTITDRTGGPAPEDGYHKCTITARTRGPAPEDRYHKCTITARTGRTIIKHMDIISVPYKLVHHHQMIDITSAPYKLVHHHQMIEITSAPYQLRQ